MKYPYIQLFAGDYLSDPKLSLCSAATRGVFMDFLCVMHMNDRCGVITGTREQLARLGRCSTVEVSTAIEELDTHDAADVTERNGIVTVICRRMKRDADARKQSRLRVQKHRENADVTPTETQKPLLVYGDGTGTSVLKGGVGGNPALEEVLTWCNMSAAIPKDCGTAFWNSMEACGWLDRAQRPVRNWRPLLNNYFNTWKANHEKDKRNGNNRTSEKPNPRNFGIGGDAAKRTAAVVAKVAAMQTKHDREQPKN